MSEQPQQRRRPTAEDGREVVDSLPGLARLAATAWWHTAEWTAQTSFTAGRRILGVVVHPETALDLVQDVRNGARGYARELIGIEELASQPGQYTPPPAPQSNGRRGAPADSVLTARGRQLLRMSSDVRYEEPVHPAHERILDELAPDEGRVLRLLLLSGPQPSVDVRTGGPMGLIGSSRLIAPGLTMIGARAGCRYVERVPAYLNNLYRLGLIWFSREMLHDAHQYQVVEAQPDVLAAMHSVRQAKLVRRSIHLTPFGEDFCRVCLELDDRPFGPLPVHAAPEGDDLAGQPPLP